MTSPAPSPSRIAPSPSRIAPLPSPIAKKNFVCDAVGCGRAFNDKSNLNRHRRGVHQKLKLFVCEHIGCGLSFGQRMQLQRHTKRENHGCPNIDAMGSGPPPVAGSAALILPSALPGSLGPTGAPERVLASEAAAAEVPAEGASQAAAAAAAVVTAMKAETMPQFSIPGTSSASAPMQGMELEEIDVAAVDARAAWRAASTTLKAKEAEAKRLATAAAKAEAVAADAKAEVVKAATKAWTFAVARAEKREAAVVFADAQAVLTNRQAADAWKAWKAWKAAKVEADAWKAEIGD